MTLFDHSTSDSTTSSADEPLFLHEFFERAALRYPRGTALDIPPGIDRPDRRVFTYSEIERQANALANHLRKFVASECAVAILLSRNTEHLYISQLAALKAGAAYTCIDPTFPEEQVRDILEDSEAVALLTDHVGVARAKRCGFDPERTIDVAGLLSRASHQENIIAPPTWLTPGSLAYIIYTSGTTGRPKGVMIEHRSIVNLVIADRDEFGLSPQDRVGQSSSAAYDSSVEEMWLGFAAGATVVVMDDNTTRLGPDLIPWLRREHITVLCPPPTLLRTTGCEDPEAALPDLSFLYVGGEALPRDVADCWARGRRLVNGYGPTECTVTALRGRIIEKEPITIGRPARGIQAWVLDESLEEVRDSEKGELYLGGICLARGYHKRPELTAEKFLEHPRLGRIYRTGDLVHRDLNGSFFYHGRIDSQIKLRGYRVELEAIEARLSECDGVREAACRVQGNGSHQTLVAFVVPDNCHGPSFDDLKASLMKVLPAHMIPGRLATVAELPRTVGGKLNRNKLPLIEDHVGSRNGHRIAPRNEIETKLESAFREVLNLGADISVHDDFFNDLSGDSLSAAELISLLRSESLTASLTVRDLYESRTVAGLATRAGVEPRVEAVIKDDIQRSKGWPRLATCVQIIWLLVGLMLVSSVAYVLAFDFLPVLIAGLGLIPFLLLSPFFSFALLLLYTPVALLLVMMVKKILIGRYRPLRAPAWGSFYVRNWMVQQTARIVPWTLLSGTIFQIAALRALGARIGKGVHIHRGVSLLQGGWDLLDIGDNVTISQDASIRLVDFDDGEVVVDAITLGDDCTLDVRSGVGGNTVLERGAFLTALSSLPSGARIPRNERWDGIPARPAGEAPPRPALTDDASVLSPFLHAVVLVLARFGLALVVAIPLALLALSFSFIYGFDAESAAGWLSRPSLDASFLIPAILIATVPGPVALALKALVMRALGEVREGVISRWSMAYIQVLLKTRMVQRAGDWLSGTLFWPFWLRLAGMKVGRDCEISTIIDVVPELIEIGRESFFADGIYLGGPRVHRGTVTLARTRLGENTFLGNHAVIPAGQHLPAKVLLGVCTAVDQEPVGAGTSWFGHPPFELQRREAIEVDRSLTYEPSLIRYANRVFWEALRSGLPVLPFLIFPVWFDLLSRAEAAMSRPVFLLTVLPIATLGIGAFFCLLVLALKWLLLGRVRPDTHPLWSCWCSRWDFLYVAWAVYAARVLAALEGTLLLSWYLRAMGMRIGRRVVLGSGFTQVVDPDMLEFEDGATVSCQFQAHTFEDRVLKIDRVRIRKRATVGTAAVLLYGSDIGARTRVAPHSVVMKRENLLPDRSYTGCPTHPVQK
ncbi:MAG TPA: amino acid adenylation domain-containing protein [Blastocatellia bacterium]|nr:amino acid adenylation domain-containing protein [Blastocatellia bacterium]